jgi:malate/lactate dehydrogenase
MSGLGLRSLAPALILLLLVSVAIAQVSPEIRLGAKGVISVNAHGAGSLLRNENSVLTVSTLLDDYYDVSDVCLSVPVVLNRNGISKTLRIGLDESEIRQFQASAKVLKDVMTALDL